jgi:hypothetical protein
MVEQCRIAAKGSQAISRLNRERSNGIHDLSARQFVHWPKKAISD